MKKFIKFLSLTLTFLLTFSFIGCNKVPTNDETSNISVQLTSSETIIDNENNTVSKTITATVYPEDAPNKLVDWSIDWDVNNIGDDAIISDYITITPLEDGSNVAIVTCYQGFENSSFIISVKTRACGLVATCLVTYDGAPENFYFIYNDVEYFNETPIINLVADNTYTFNLSLSNTLGAVGSKYGQFSVKSIGGKGSFIIYEIGMADSRLISFNEFLYTDKSNYTDFNLKEFFNVSLNENLLTLKCIGNEKTFNTQFYYYVEDDKNEDCSFYIVIEETISHKTFTFNFDITNTVNNVTLDNSELVF